MPIGEDSPARVRNLPLALSIAVAVNGSQMRCTSWSMKEPSLEAKNFCSLTRNSVELMKSAPALSAAAFSDSSMSTLSLIGTAIAFVRIGVFQLTSPTPLTGASCTGRVWMPALARAIAAACSTVASTAAGVCWWVAAKPQAPLTITRMPMPEDSLLVTFWTLLSRVMIAWLR